MAVGRQRGRVGAQAGALLVGACLSDVAAGGAWTPEQGGGAVTLAAQYSHVQSHLGPDGEKIDVGSINTRSLFAQVTYGITDRIAVNLSIPYVQKQYKGPAYHRIVDEDGDLHASEEDNGNYHGDFQDVTVGVQYQASWGDWAVTPFATYGSPSTDYEHFAHAAIGAEQEKLEIGVEAGRILAPPFDRLYVQGGYSYSFVEKYRNVNVDRSTLTLEGDYYATNRIVLRAFVIGQKTHGGLDFPNEYPYTYPPPNTSRTPEDIALYYHHDQTQRVDFVEAGVGGSYALSPVTGVFTSVLRTLWGENGHATDYALSIGVSRNF